MFSICDRDGYDRICVAVETGTFEAETTRLLRTVFPLVLTIELEPDRWRTAMNFGGEEGITYLLGDSEQIVPLLAKAYSDVQVFWFLDAHWFSKECGSDGEFGLPVAKDNPCPLWGELRAILSRRQKDIVVVDDVHAFGMERIGDVTGWKEITAESIDAYLGDRRVESKIIGDVYVAYLE